MRNSALMGVAAATIALALAVAPTPLRAQQTALQVGATDLGGVVTGPNGPEAGVWVIAETTDLPTKYSKIVVTDDRGRFVIPNCRARITTSGSAATASSIRPRRRRCLAARSTSRAVPAPNAKRGRRVLSADPLVRDAEGAGQGDFPLGRVQNQPVMAAHAQDRRLHGLPRARHARDAHDAEAVTPTSDHDRRMGATHPGRQAMTRWQRRPAGFEPASRSSLFADWTDRIAKGELPFDQAGATAGHRAQRRHHAVGLEPSDRLSA